MHDHYDRFENRTPLARETALLRDLSHILSVSKNRVPAIRAQLKGLALGKTVSRDDLARIPIRRHADLASGQADAPPFGGFAATRLAALAQVFVGPGMVFSLAGQAKDWWGMGRALYAAGLRKGTLVLNAMTYDLEPDGHMVEAGARAIGCPVVPAGRAPVEIVASVVARLSPRFFCGHADTLKQLLDADSLIGLPTSPFKHALVTGPLKPGLRSELMLRGTEVRHAVVLPAFGVVAYESGRTDGLMLSEGLILEIVDPESGAPVSDGTEGEMVLSRINLDYPLLRYGTGLIAAVLTQPSTCGRTNVRITPPRPKCLPDIDGAHILEIRKRHPGLKMRLCVVRPHGTLHLKVEHRGDEPTLRETLGETLQFVTRQRGMVEIVRPGTLLDDEGQGEGTPRQASREPALGGSTR